MPFFASLLVVPLLLLGFSKRDDYRAFTALEIVLYLALNAGMASCAARQVFEANVADTEVWNGWVHGRNVEDVSCSHSYECNCHEVCEGEGSDERCHESCSTCYLHDFDRVWKVLTTAGEVRIPTEDLQGLVQPPGWTRARPGQPAAVLHPYQNYLKGAGVGVFVESESFPEYEAILPDYPDRIVEHYRLDRVVQVGGRTLEVGEHRAWNDELMLLNARLGKRRQVNVIVVLAADLPPRFARALRQHWLGGRKNDCVVVLGTIPRGAMKPPRWVRVFAWSRSDAFEEGLTTHLEGLGALDPATFLPAIEKKVDRLFVRKPMEDLAHLKNLVKPTWKQWFLFMAGCAVVSFFLMLFFHENDTRYYD